MNLACAAKSYADGPGLKPGNKASDDAVFTIHAVTPDGKPKKTGGDVFDVQIEDPNKNLVPADIEDNNNGTYTVKYKPTIPGNYHVEILQRNPTNPLYFDHIKNSPVDVQVDPGTDAANCIAYGPGLEPGKLDDKPAQFTIESRDKNGVRRKEGGEVFDVDIQGPNGPIKAKVADNGDGTYKVTYQPEDAGIHDIAVTLGDIPIKGSTFHVDIAPTAWAANSSVELCTLLVQTRDRKNRNMTVGGAPLKVDVQGPNKQKVNVDLKDLNDGTYTAKFPIKAKGQHSVSVTIDGLHVQGSPLTQNVQ